MQLITLRCIKQHIFSDPDTLLLGPLLDLIIILLLIHLFKIGINLRLEHLEILHLLLDPILVFLRGGGGCLRPDDLLASHHDIFEDLLLVGTDCHLVLPPVARDRAGCRLEDTHVGT